MTGAGSVRAELAAGWVAHLRDGGTTPWRRWLDHPEDPEDGSAADRVVGESGPQDVPGAAQLELLRRLNEVAPLPHRVDHVLSRPGPGRGPVHLSLPASGRPAPRPEVLRVAAGVLADLTAELVTPKERRFLGRRKEPRPVEGAPRFVLEGPPVTVAELGARLTAVGLPPHRPPFSWLGARPDPGPELVVVVARPLDDALHEVWSSRVQQGAARSWRRFVTHWAGRRALPPSAALDRIVYHWTRRIGAADVHVVVAEPGADLVDRVAELLGATSTAVGAGTSRAAPLPVVRGRPAPLVPARLDPVVPVRLEPATVDAVRRVNAVLPFVCSPADQPRRLAALVRLAAPARTASRRTDPGEPPGLPKRHRGWAAGNATHVAEALRGSGCSIHGDLGSLRELRVPNGRRIDGGDVLDVMVRMIHRVDAELAGRSRGGRGGR